MNPDAVPPAPPDPSSPEGELTRLELVELLSDSAPVEIATSQRELYCLLLAAQRGLYDPTFHGEPRAVAEGMARNLATLLTADRPRVAQLLALGEPRPRRIILPPGGGAG
jgi:hypothetical protein